MISIDSDCIIDFLKGKKEAVDIINKYKDELVTTEINVFEVFVGIYKNKKIEEKEGKVAKSFFESLEILNCGSFGLKGASLFCELINNGRKLNKMIV